MRLLQRLQDGAFELTSFDDEHPPLYAVLSHTWIKGQEVTYNEVVAGGGGNKTGYDKFRFCAEQAATDGYQYFWIDTCCINKADSAELSTAINSMYRWYQRAAKCYVYLSDVSIPVEVVDAQAFPIVWMEAFRQSRWFTRGWTLQELLAPASIEFFSREGKRLGSKISLEQEIHEITGIPTEVLRGRKLSNFSVEERMSWAAGRTTTVKEDKIYSLLGIFGVFLPLIYGEGEQYAALRLKEEIQRHQQGQAIESLRDSASVSQALQVGLSSSIETHIHAPERPESPPRPSCFVPFRRDEDFVDRRTLLDQIREQCSAPASRIALVGLGGVGKSQLAIEHCYRTAEQSPDTWVFWAHASNTARLEQSFRDIADQVKVRGRKDPQADVFKLVHDWLRDAKNGQWLLVLDNADDAAVLSPPPSNNQTSPADGCVDDSGGGVSTSTSGLQRHLSKYLPQSRHGSVLVTSRTRRAAVQIVEDRDVISIEPIHDAAAYELLYKKLGDKVDKSDGIAELAAALEYMPLALVQAAAYIRKRAPRYSVRQYVEEYRQSDSGKTSLLNREADSLPNADVHGLHDLKKKFGSGLVAADARQLNQAFAFNDAASDSAYESGFSDTASVWSVAFSEDSHSSNGELQYVTQSATQKMAEIFWQSSELQSLYSEASHRLPKNMFAKTHDDLLKTFFADLRSETANDRQLKTVRIMRHRAHRQQVTEWIYSWAGPELDSEALEARQNFLSHRETRDELLERFLQSHTEPSKIERGTKREPVPVQAGESSDEEEEDPISLEELNAIIKFLISGSSFEMLRINLHGLAHPETAIAEALRTGKVKVLQALLTKQFSRVATGDYDWIKELDAAGYSKAEIAQLLVDETADSPWILFTPQVTDLTACAVAEPQFHVPGCIHKGEAPEAGRANTPLLLDSNTSNELLQELCGIAGVAPISRNKRSWNGSVQFAEHSSIAAVTYTVLEPDSENGSQALLARSIWALEALIGAVGSFQATQGCCNGYSVMVHDELPAFTTSSALNDIGTVELCRISVEQLQKLSTEARRVQLLANTRPVQRRDVILLQLAALHVLETLGRHHFPTVSRLTYDETLHLVALSAQFASLVFLSYTQAHIAPLQPFYLDTALRKITLLGTGDPQKPPFRIIAETTRLTCLGDMLQAPVMVFYVESGHIFGGSPSLGPRANSRYDVIASAEDLIDTWDGGSLIAPTQKHEGGRHYHAIQICGGIIIPIDSTATEQARSSLFHWSPNATLNSDVTFDVAERICIGAFVTVNSGCLIDESRCWRSSAPAFRSLGVQSSVWRHDESQFGGQAGQYVLFQYMRTKRKIPGTPLKTCILRDLSNQIYSARHILNKLWGLQVSFCTGVARRVPLRVLMSDLMPTVAESLPCLKEKWAELNKQNCVINAFATESVMTWFDNLSQPQSTFIDQLMRKVLLTLELTGVDEDRTKLTVAWVYARPPYHCFWVPCNDKKNSWLGVLSESEDCATFAYIVTSCLETSAVKCHGPSPCWNSTAPLLETAVTQYNLQLSRPKGLLEHKKTYFFKKMELLLQVTAEKQTAGEPVSLYISPSSIPAKMKQRLFYLERVRNQVTTIREQEESGEMGAEDVAVCTKM